LIIDKPDDILIKMLFLNLTTIIININDLEKWRRRGVRLRGEDVSEERCMIWYGDKSGPLSDMSV
jgi:hypothetical protein